MLLQAKTLKLLITQWNYYKQVRVLFFVHLTYFTCIIVIFAILL